MAQTQPLSRRQAVLFVIGLVYVWVVENLWSQAVNHYHILQRYPLLIPFGLWWWAIVLLPLTTVIALMRIPLRRAIIAFAAFVAIELIAWEVYILNHLIRAFGVRMAAAMESHTFIFELLFGVILGSINILIQLAVFLFLGKLVTIFNSTTRQNG